MTISWGDTKHTIAWVIMLKGKNWLMDGLTMKERFLLHREIRNFNGYPFQNCFFFAFCAFVRIVYLTNASHVNLYDVYIKNPFDF